MHPHSAHPDATRADACGLVAVAMLAYALCDLLHEGAHAAATLLPLGVKALSISTVAVSSYGSSPVVAGAGIAMNLLLGGFILAPAVSRRPSTATYFCWLLGSIDLFSATGYLVYSGALGSGDVAVVLDPLAAPALWRPCAIVAGIVAYAAAVRVSLAGLRRLVALGVVPAARLEASCMVPYWSGALLLVAGAVPNPVSPWLILASGAAGGLGAMVGLALLPPLARVGATTASATMPIGRAWRLAGAFAAIAFVGLFGPGIRLA
jgi:hypothetical protein